MEPFRDSYLRTIPYFYQHFNTKLLNWSDSILSVITRLLSIKSVPLPIKAQVLCLCKLNKAQRPTMRPQAFLGISSYKEKRDAWRKSEYGNSHLWW